MNTDCRSKSQGFSLSTRLFAEVGEPLINRKNILITDYKLNMRAKSMHQLSFEDTTYLNRPRKTRMQKFLERMDAVLPWN